MAIIIQSIIDEINEEIEKTGFRKKYFLDDVFKPVFKKYFPDHSFSTYHQQNNKFAVQISINDQDKDLGKAFLFRFKTKSKRETGRLGQYYMVLRSIEIDSSIKNDDLEKTIEQIIKDKYASLDTKEQARKNFHERLNYHGLTRDQFNDLVAEWRSIGELSHDELKYKANEIIHDYDFTSIKEGKEANEANVSGWRVKENRDSFDLCKAIFIAFMDGSSKSFEFHVYFTLDGYFLKTVVS